MNDGLKKISEGLGEASARSDVSQKSRILDLTSLLNEFLDGGFCSRCRGDGREYFWHKCRIDTNQDFEESGSDARMVDAVLKRMFFGSLEIMPNILSCCLCTWAFIGTVPDKK